MSEKLAVDRIDSSLSHGKLFTGRQKVLLNIFLCVFCFLGSLILCVLIAMWSQHKTEIQLQYVFIAVFGIMLLIILPIIVVAWRILHNKKLIKKIEIWLKDAVLLTANGKRLTNSPYSPSQVEIEFYFEKKRKKIKSTAGNKILGYYKFFSENKKTVQILYSPKYNEVLILKD